MRFLFVNHCGVDVPLVLEGRQMDAVCLQVSWHMLLRCSRGRGAAGARGAAGDGAEAALMLTRLCLVMVFYLGISADGIFLMVHTLYNQER